MAAVTDASRGFIRGEDDSLRDALGIRKEGTQQRISDEIMGPHEILSDCLDRKCLMFGDGRVITVLGEEPAVVFSGIRVHIVGATVQHETS